MKYTPVQIRLQKNLIKIINDRKLSVRKLSLKAGISWSVIGGIVSGKVESPDLEDVKKIADALNMSVGELLKEEE